MAGLRELGAHAHLCDTDGEDIGFCHLPWPLSLGDLAAVEGQTYRVVDFVDLPCGEIDVTALVEPAWLAHTE
jgi:sugar phosphate isomerase/epimerase